MEEQMGKQARLLGEDGEDGEGVENPGKKEYRPKTKHGYMLDEVVSSLTKEVRRGNEDRALFWAMEMCLSGYAKYFWTRLSVLVPEEIGLADPIAMVVVNNAFQMFERRVKKWSEGPITTELVGMVILYLCRAPKNGEAADAAYATEEEMDQGRREEVQEYARDMHTQAGREMIERARWTKEEEELWWWMELNKKENLQGGNRWIRRMINAVKHLSPAAKRQVIEARLAEYEGMSEESQL